MGDVHFSTIFYAIDPSKTSSLNSAQLDDFSGVFFFWIFRVWKIAIMRIRILKFSRIDPALALKNTMHVPGGKDLPNQLCIHSYSCKSGGGDIQTKMTMKWPLKLQRYWKREGLYGKKELLSAWKCTFFMFMFIPEVYN